MTNEILQLDDIIIDNGLNPREGALDQEVILDYAAHVDDLPPMRVFRLDQAGDIGPGYYLVSGFHRIAAHRLAGRTSAHFIVHVGMMEEAKEFADLDNLKHGLRLSRAERRAVIERQLKRHPDWSDTRLALACSTSDKTVRVVREELEQTSEIPRFDVLVGSDGIERPRTVSRATVPMDASRQAGFESAEPGDVITLEPGTYTLPGETTTGATIVGTSEEPEDDDAKDLAELERLEAEERTAAERDAELLPQEDAAPAFAAALAEGFERNEPAPAPDPAELRKQLSRALGLNDPTTANRWAGRRERGLSNAELYEAIGREFHDGGASGPNDPGYSSKGGRDPRLWLGHKWQSGSPALQGAALRDAVRELLEIPYPGAKPFLGPAPTEAPKLPPSLTLNISVRADGSALITALLGINPVVTKVTMREDVGLDVQLIVNEHAPRPPAIVEEAELPEAAPEWLIPDTFTVNNGE